MGLTLLSKLYLMVISIMLIYGFIGGLSCPILTGFIMIMLGFGFCYYISKDMEHKDKDYLTVSCIHKSTFNAPKHEISPPLTQNCVAYFENKINFNELKSEIKVLFLRFKRLRSLGVKSKNDPNWNTKWKEIDMTDDILSQMIRKITVKNMVELYDAIDNICNTQLNDNFPRWELVYIDNESCTGNNNEYSCWIWRVSHGVSDGLRLVSVAADLLTDKNGNKIGLPQIGKFKSKKGRKKNSINSSTILKGIAQAFKDLIQINSMVNGKFDSISPLKMDKKLHGFNTSSKFKVIRNKDDQALSVELIKKLKNKYNVGVNDILTTLLCCGIRHYILSKDPDYFKSSKKEYYFSCALAFGFPAKEKYCGQEDFLGNGFVLTKYELPIKNDNFMDTLTDVYKNTLQLKTSFVAILGDLMLQFVCKLGLDSFLRTNSSNMFARRHCVFSNVPGWQKDVFYKNNKMIKVEASYLNWIPQFIFCSYNGYYYGTLSIDTNIYKDTSIIFEYMYQELIKQANHL